MPSRNPQAALATEAPIRVLLVSPRPEDESAGYLFAVLHFPVYNAGVGRLDAGEIDLFVGSDYLVTLPTVELKPAGMSWRLFARSF